ncbi:hypothetical protein GZH46_00547, partial [Fragariocoptes setiger]
ANKRASKQIDDTHHSSEITIEIAIAIAITINKKYTRGFAGWVDVAAAPSALLARSRQLRRTPGGMSIPTHNEYPFLLKKCNNILTGNFEALFKYEGSETGSLKCNLVPLNRPQRIQKCKNYFDSLSGCGENRWDKSEK